MFTHICEICGETFESSSNRAKYCVYCRDKAQVLRNKAYMEKKKAGTSLTVGSDKSVRSAVRRILSRAVLRNAVRNVKKSNGMQRKSLIHSM